MTWSEVLHALIQCETIPWSILEKKRNFEIDVQNTNDYFNACKIILMKFDNSIIIDGREAILDDIILKHQPSVFINLVTSLSSLTENSYRKDKFLDLISKFINMPNHLEQMMLSISTDDLESVHFINTIINTPSFVFNAFKLKTLPFFAPVNYFKRICQSLYHCLQKLYQMLKHNQEIYIKFLAQLSGRICFNGHSDLFYEHVLKPILNLCKEKSCWQKIVYLLIFNQTDSHLENVIKPIFCQCQDPFKVNLIFNNLILKNKKLEYLLTQKFTIISYFNDNLVIKNIIYYVLNVSSNLLIDIFSYLLEAWSNGNLLKYRIFDQQLYICSSLIICSKHLNFVDLEQVKSKLIRLIINGIEVYLKCVQNDVRTTGLYVGQVLISKLQIDGPKLNFKIETNNQVQKLMDLASAQPLIFERSKFSLEQLEEKENENEKNSGSEEENENEFENENDNDKIEIKKPIHTKELELDSDDDDLIPFNLSNDSQVNDVKKPVYLRDCIAGLQDINNVEWFKLCLENASIIIERNHSIIEEVAVDFARTLFCLNNEYDWENFEMLRQDALVKLCCCSPISVSEFLTSQFYDHNYVIKSRLDILEILATASQKLSSHSQSPNKSNEVKSIENILPKDMVMVENQWNSMLTFPKKQKCKTISTPKQIKTYVNQFASVAGHFFFPLMKSFDKPNITFNLMEEDYFLLGKLLYTLGIILNSAALSPISRQMGEALMQFLWVFRYHTESFVRQALLFCFCSILTSVPSTYLFERLQVELLEFKQWLIDIAEKDNNENCVKRSYQALYLLKQIIDDNIK